MNKKTKRVLITITFIFILILVIMYGIHLGVVEAQTCDLFNRVCYDGIINQTEVVIDGKYFSCLEPIFNIC